jgi:hypothetical protein
MLETRCKQHCHCCASLPAQAPHRYLRESPAAFRLFHSTWFYGPRVTLPLHIFERRYKIMITRSVSQSIEFGIVRASDKAVAKMGCTAKIVRKVKDYPDGRMTPSPKAMTCFISSRFWRRRNTTKDALNTSWMNRLQLTPGKRSA